MPAEPPATGLLLYSLLLASTLLQAAAVEAAKGLLDSWPALDAHGLGRVAAHILLAGSAGAACAYAAYAVHPGRGALAVLALGVAATLISLLALLFAWAARGPGRDC